MKSPITPCGVLLCIPLASCASQQPAAPAAPVTHRLIGQDRGQVSILAPDGSVEWQVPCTHNSHDMSVLADGNVLMHPAPDRIVEMTPAKQVVWTLDDRKTFGNDLCTGWLLDAPAGTVR